MTRPRSWWPDVAFLVTFALITVLVWQGPLLGVDVAVADFSDRHRPPALYWTARVLNSLGQGGWLLMPLAALLTVLLVWKQRSIRPLLVFVSAAALLYLTVGPLKILFDRAAPRFTGPDREILFNPAASGGLAMSYPSGHAANAVIWYAVIAFLLAGLIGRTFLALRLVPPAIVLCTTTYLSWHWITDSVAGLLIGLVLARLLARVPWETMPLPGPLGAIDRRVARV